jgi:AraC-like DNA-binding protein
MKYYCRKFLSFFKNNLIETSVSLTEKKYNFLDNKTNGFLSHQVIKEGIEILKFDLKTDDGYILNNDYFNNCFILIYLEKGKFEVSSSKEKKIILNKEEIFFSYETLKSPKYKIDLSPNLRYEGIILTISEKYLTSFIDDQEIIQCINLSKNKRIFKHKHIKIFPQKLIYILKMILFYHNYLGYKLFILGKINEIIGEIITVLLRNILNETTERDIFEIIKEYIEDHYYDPKILEKVQQKFYFNKMEVSRQFKEKTGFGIYEYLKNLKLERAYYLLISEKMKVHEISELLGYKSYGYFSKIFKDYFGVSPKKVQQNFESKKTEI